MKSSKLLAALTALTLAAANTAAVQPSFCVTAADTTAATDALTYCTANISVVDMITCKVIEGIDIVIEDNPMGTSTMIESWNTKDEPVKTFTQLQKGFTYGLLLNNIPAGYSVSGSKLFSFDEDGEVKDIIIRAVPTSAKKDINFIAGDWSGATPMEGGWIGGVTEYYDPYTVYVYDKDGKFFTSETLTQRDYMYLPDGKYTIKVYPQDPDYEIITSDMDIAKTASEMFDDIFFPDKEKGLDIEVKDGKLTESTYLYFRMKPEIAEKIKDGCKANISVVDYITGEPVKNVKARLVKDSYTERTVLGEWDTTDSPTKSFKELRQLQWYEVEILDMPEGYHIDKSTSFNFSNNGDTRDIVIYAVPTDGKTNVNVAVYDWTDLKVDPADGTYEGYKPLDPKLYDISLFDLKNKTNFDLSSNDLQMPDGKYVVQVSMKEDGYNYVNAQGYKARAVRKIFGSDFVIPDGISTDIEIKDGVTVGQPCLFFEKDGSSDTHCTLNLTVIDGQTGKPAEAVEYQVVRIREEIEDKAEELGFESTYNGYMPSYGAMPESGSITVEGLEPYVKYAVIGVSASKYYGGGKPVFITFDKDGDTKDVTIKLYPFDYHEDCSARISVLDAETGRTADGAEFKVVRIPDELMSEAGSLSADDMLKKCKLVKKGKIEEDADYVIVYDLEPDVKYGVVALSGSNRYGAAASSIVVFDKKGDTEDVVMKLYPTDINPCSISINVTDGVTGKPAYAGFRVVRIPDELAGKTEDISTPDLWEMGVIAGEGHSSNETESTVIKNLDPKATYAVLVTDHSKQYGGPKPVFVTFDKNGENKEVDIKLYPFDYKTKCSASVAVEDFKGNLMSGLTVQLYSIPAELGDSPTHSDVTMRSKLINSFTTSDDSIGVFTDLEPDVLYAVIVTGYSRQYSSPEPVFFRFTADGETKNITVDLRPWDWGFYGDVNRDGSIELADAILIMQALSNPNKYGLTGTAKGHLTEEGRKYADVSGKFDGMTVNDALAIQMYLLHKIDSLPTKD